MSKIQNLKNSLSRKQRVLILVIAAVVLLGVLTATVFRDDAASFLRRVTYSQTQSGFAHNAQASSLFLAMDHNLLICTQSQIQLVSASGTARLKETVTMNSPSLNASGKYAVVYDVGGQELRVIAGEKLTHSLTLTADKSILCATVNKNGWIAVTTKEDGYKGVVTVYDNAFAPVLSIRLSSRYISDAVVTPDSKGVYLISPGQSGGAFENSMLYYALSSNEDPIKEISLGSNVILAIQSSGNCWILGDRSLMILDSSGVITAKYDYNGQYLKMGSLKGDNFATLILSRSSSGSSGTLVSVSSDGTETGKLAIDGQVLAVTAQKHDIAVLTAGEVILANRELDRYTIDDSQQGIRNIALYSDGSAALINSSSVKLYYPPSSAVKTDTSKEAAE